MFDVICTEILSQMCREKMEKDSGMLFSQNLGHQIPIRLNC